MPLPAGKLLTAAMCAILVLATLCVYWQVHRFDFVNLDDNVYVYENPHIQGGLTLDNVTWAFKTGYASFWHPLTWLSFMLDYQLFGGNAGWMHLTGVFLHLAGTLLLFAALSKMTDAPWPSFFVAAVFAIHPMHVESVAWIAERKDVLSTFFMMLALLAYAFYARSGGKARYFLTLLLFVLGLMAKTMIITLPFLLLLLDYWPLNRLGTRKMLYRAVIEKIPFVAAAAVFSVITVVCQQSGGGLTDLRTVSLQDRLVNAIASYAAYIARAFWPHNMAVPYPLDIGAIGAWHIVIGITLLVGISVLVLRFLRSRKYLAVGWFWFLGTLVPVIGIIRFTPSAYADRFTYVPYIGLSIMVAWGLPQLLSKWRYRELALGISAGASLMALGTCAWLQTSYWKNSITLFSHSIEATRNNSLAHYNRGVAYGKAGRWQNAMEDYEKAIAIRPDYADALAAIGPIYGGFGRLQDAMNVLRKATKLSPDYVEAHYNLGNACSQAGLKKEAAAQFRQVVRLTPDDVQACSSLAWLIATHPEIADRNPDEAIRLADHACQLTDYRNPSFVATLAAAYASAGRFTEAADTANKAIRLAGDANLPQLKNAITNHLSFYTQGKPYIESAAPATQP